MTRSEYLIDRQDAEARRRFDRIQALEDPPTIAHLDTIGVAEGWRCLEVGGGGGSIARWLCERVGSEGRVVATDLDPRFLERLGFPQLEVRKHDIALDPLESGAFDLIHARSVLMHVADRETVLDRILDALGPGGWVLLEEPDAITDAPAPEASPDSRALYMKVSRAIYAFVETRGVDPYFGARLPGLLRARGLASLHVEGRILFYRGGPEAPPSPHMMAFGELREPVVAMGQVSTDEYDAFLALAEDPSFAWREGIMVSARGRRPG